MNVGLCIWMTSNPAVVVKEDTAIMTLKDPGCRVLTALLGTFTLN